MAPYARPSKKCAVDDCARFTQGTYCTMHYKRLWRNGTLERTLADYSDGQLCSTPSCGRLATGKGRCKPCNLRLSRRGTTDRAVAPQGEGGINTQGYRVMTIPGGRRQYEHILVAEKALGKALPLGAVVHHITENPSDNHGFCKLVVCPDQGYHLLIHRLMREKGISFKQGWPNA